MGMDEMSSKLENLLFYFSWVIFIDQSEHRDLTFIKLCRFLKQRVGDQPQWLFVGLLGCSVQ